MIDYRIDDFTIGRYKDFLVEAKKTFAFADYHNLPETGKHILLRHDLDLSIQAAYKIALAEYELGVKSTFFLLLHSSFYNLLDSQNFAIVSKIIEMNHSIGLHFDSHFYGISSEEELHEKIIFEKNILESFFNISIKSFSFHLTNNFTMNCKKMYYGGLINSYASIFQSEYSYCSDSYGLWRFERLFDFIKVKGRDKLQILTHPEWWVHEAAYPAQRIQNIINTIITDLNSDAVQKYIYKS